MLEIPERCKLTFDDFRVLVHDERKGDLLNGVLYLSPPERPAANLLSGWLLSCVYGFVQDAEIGRVLAVKFAFRFDKYNVVQPDLAFVSKRRSRILRHNFAAGAPDLVMEVVAPDSIERDYELKRNLYERAGVREYWIIDEVFEKVTLLRLNGQGKYRRVAVSGGALKSKVLPGLWLRPEWLWQRPLPKKADVLNEIFSTK